jgi:glycosyltransferase involved in cell wall biosynthesis
MAESPLVSVTMPVYNGERTIQLAINSLLHQTYPNWKCIIVNDCSTDGTGEILKKYESDLRFKIIHLSKNKGRGNARQIALENAEGDYLAFLDADDFYHPEKLEWQVKAFHDYPNITVCSTGVGSFDNNYKLRTYRGFTQNNYGSNYKSKLYPGFPASCMIKLSIAQKNTYNLLLDVGEDNDFIFKCLFGKDYYVINQILYYYEEIGVVSYRKFVSYQIKYIYTLITTISGSQLLFSLSKEIPKLIVKCVGALFLGVDYFILKRGPIASEYDISEYNRILSILNID